MATKKKTAEELVSEQTETETVEYKHDAVDGDNDGLVQDGTPFERPVKTHIVTYGETYPSIAELYRGSETNYAYAKKLKALNAKKHLTSGTVLTLPEKLSYK